LRAIVAHGGGPTAVLNASLAGVMGAWRELGSNGALFGARFGVAGDWIDLTAVERLRIEAIRKSPGSVLGSSRRKLEPDEIAATVERMRDRGISALLLAGGNGSMQTLRVFQQTAATLHPDLRVVGIPKTVDNDLLVTDHTPGFGSAARFYAHAVRDIGLDNRALPAPVTIVEIIGRNAGWVTGATALARAYPDDAPHLIYLPERPLSLEAICSAVADTCRRIGRAVVAVCEGLRDPTGEPFGADLDRPGARSRELAMNLAYTLARAVTARTGIRARAEKPGLLGRSCSFAVSEVDRDEAFLCGAEAVRAAAQGYSGVMVALRRVSSTPYRSETFLAPLEKVAGIERCVPAEWIASSGDGVTHAFLDYVRPLAGEIAAHARLD
jgi:6-phosphofructokinase 1